MDDSMCPECRTETKVVHDYASGDTICTECGLVLEERFIDERPEWRSFADDSADGGDPARVGGALNPLLRDGGLGTDISTKKGAERGAQARANQLVSSLVRSQKMAGSNPDRSLVEAFYTIATMADRLSLVPTIKDRANEIYKKVYDLRSVCAGSRNRNAVLAACLYIACLQEVNSRTLKEICSVTDGASLKEIGRAKTFIVKQLGEVKGGPIETRMMHVEDSSLRRFCSHLGMNNHCIRAVTAVVNKAQYLDIRRSPASIAAASIYMISQLLGDGMERPLEDIARATGVAEVTIRKAYKDVYPHACSIVPDWFAKDHDLRKLRST